MVKDRNKNTTVILRNFNCELIDNLKKFTNENTSTKAIELVCARYLSLEKLADKQREQIREMNSKLTDVSQDLECYFGIESRLKKFKHNK